MMGDFRLDKNGIIIISLLFILALAGCTVRPVINRTPAHQYVNVELASSSLQDNIIISSLHGRIDNDMLSINVTFFIDSIFDMRLQYKIKWFDQFGNPVSEDLFNWTPLIARANQSFTVSKRAVSNKSATAIIVIQEK